MVSFCAKRTREEEIWFLTGYRYYSSLDSSTSYVLLVLSACLEGTKNRISQSVSAPQSLSSEDLLDDNSLQLRVVNGSGASWFLHNLWCLVNHPIIPGSSVSLSLAASRSSTSTLLPSSLTLYRDIICFHTTRQEKQLSIGWSKTINCYKNVSVQVSEESIKRLSKIHFSPFQENHATFCYILCTQDLIHI